MSSPLPTKRPLSPSSLRDLSSPSAPLARPPSFPAPPTGHDLMLLFPPAAPALRDIDIVAGVDRPFAEHQNRLSPFQGQVRARVLAGRYVNTSTWFGKEERAFFSAPSSSSSSSSSASSSSSSLSSSPHAHPREREQRERDIVPPPAAPPQHTQLPRRPSLPRSSRTPSPRHRSAPTKPPLPPPSATTTNTTTTTRRRAGKYTKRVFVQPHTDAVVKW